MTVAGSDAALDDSYDVVVIGAGAAGLAAAAIARQRGLSVLLAEKRPQVGGTSAVSGGMIWAPVNRLQAEAGLKDSREQVRTYLAGTVDNADGDPVLATFVDRAGEAIDYLIDTVGLELQPVLRYPDYYQAVEGATPGGRVLESKPFDIRRLGDRMDLLARPLPELTLFGGMMVSRADLPAFMRAHRSPAAFLKVARLTARYGLDRMTIGRGGKLVLGNALVARLLEACLRSGVTVATDTGLAGLATDGARVTGVDLTHQGATRRVAVRRGVILAGGGFSHDAALRRHFLPAEVGMVSAASPGDAGETIAAAVAAGAALKGMARDNALWVPLSKFTRPDGSTAIFPHTVTDRGKPGVIAVTPDGRRFVNEAMNYHHFCQALLKVTPAGEAARAILVCDADFIRKYGLGAVRPLGIGRKRMLANGYLTEAPTIAALAEKLGLPADALTGTVARFNDGAARGEDPEFHRGSDAYQRHFGDASHGPNPCVAPIVRAPFYAITVYPADLGTAAGLDTDTEARVVREAGGTFDNLHACGNDMRSVMNGGYPGPGITLGPAVVFAYIAATALAGGPA